MGVRISSGVQKFYRYIEIINFISYICIMKKVIDRIVDYSYIEIADVPKRFMKLVEEVGEWSASYLESIGFKVSKTPKTEQQLYEHLLEEGADTLIMVYDVLLKMGYSPEQIQAKMDEKLNDWEKILINRGLILKTKKEEIEVYNDTSHIIQNAVQCGSCGEIMNSTHVHDYVTCSCPFRVGADGGSDYLKRVGDMSQIIDLSVYDDSPKQVIKERLLWGTYGKEGKDQFKWVKLIDCTTEHLQGILNNVSNIKPFHRDIIQEILNDRG